MFKKYLKTVWFWLIFTPFLYALVGFFFLPWLVTSQTPSLLKERFGLNLSIEKTTLNPFTFEVNINGLSLNDANASKIIGLSHVYIDYDLLPLFHKKIFIKSFIIDTPFIDMQIDKEGSFNLVKLFSHIPPTDTQENTKNEDSSLSFLIGQIEIKDGTLSFQDFMPQEPFALLLGPFNYTVNNLGFEKEDLSIHALKSILEDEEKISLASSATLDPLKFHGELILNNIQLPKIWHYTMQNIPMKLSSGNLFMRLPFLIDLSKETPLISIEKASMTLNKLSLGNGGEKPLIDIPRLSAEDINMEWPKATLSVDKITLLDPFVDVQLEKNYATNLAKLFMPTSQKSTYEAPKDSNTTSLPWSVNLKTLGIENGKVDIIDHNVKGGKTQLVGLDIKLQNITTDLNQTMTYKLNSSIDTNRSKITLEGSFVPENVSFDTAIETNLFPVNKAQPYLEAFTTLLLKEGMLTSKSHFKGSFGGTKEPLIKLSSKLNLTKLSIHDKFKKPILAWDTLTVEEIDYASMPSSLHVGKVLLEKPYVNLDIKKDKTSNFTGILKPLPPQKKSSKQDKPMEMVLGTMMLKKGSTNFKDASLPIPFATFINNLNGSFSTLNTKNTKPSRLLLEGKVDKYGYAKIEGSLLPFDFKDRASLKILFKNIDMPSLTPYSGKFIGYAIQKGKLSMDLFYKINKGMMIGENKINLDSLTLGEKIESEEAVNLPLGLAIAILKDSNGQIDLNLPVDGDLNSPDFKYGSIVWKALGNLIGSILTSPFSLLGSMLGIETESLKSIEFPGGEFEIIASEDEKMEQYKQILAKKSELKLIIAPSFNEELDALGLREKEVEKQIELITKGSKEENSYGKALKTLFIKKLSSEAYDTVIKAYKEEKLDLGAINENLKSKIAQALPVSIEELTALANKRADEIIQNLTQKQSIAPQRIIRGELQLSDAIREKWVGCAVNVSN